MAAKDLFSLDPAPTFWADVPLSIPGRKEPHVIEVEFPHKDAEELDAWIKSNKDRDNLDVIASIVKNWRGVDVPLTREALAKLLNNFPASGTDIYIAYMREERASKAKN